MDVAVIPTCYARLQVPNKGSNSALPSLYSSPNSSPGELSRQDKLPVRCLPRQSKLVVGGYDLLSHW